MQGVICYPVSKRMMRWDVVDSGFKIVLSPAIPDLVRVDDFLAAHGLERCAISHWIAHTGGNRVLAALDLAPGAFERSWRLLGATGNLSSARAGRAGANRRVPLRCGDV